MTPEQKQALQEHIQAMPAAGYAYAKILYEDTSKEKLTNLAGIEETVQSQMQKHVMPEVGVFLSKRLHRIYYEKVKLRLLLPYLQIVKANKYKTFAVILISIAITLSTTNIIKLKKFVQLVLVRLESAVKQVDHRAKISGAQWKRENLPQVLAHRCAYLNGLLSI